MEAARLRDPARAEISEAGGSNKRPVSEWRVIRPEHGVGGEQTIPISSPNAAIKGEV